MSERLAQLEQLVRSKIPEDIDVASFRPGLNKRNPLYQSWFYPLLGVYRLGTDFTVAKPIVFSTLVALLQSGILTSAYVYISFKYVHWFVSKHLLGFSYFNLRPLFSVIQYVSGQEFTQDRTEWYMALLLTLFQAAILSNSLVGYKIRAQGKRAGEAVLSTRPRREQTSISKREVQERSFAGGFVTRLIKNSLWNTFILPIYALPVFGQILYAYFRAPAVTQGYLSMFGARKLGSDHRYAVIGFGLVGGLLSSLPFIGHFFSITNSVGAALWIQDMEHLGEEVQPEEKSILSNSGDST